MIHQYYTLRGYIYVASHSVSDLLLYNNYNCIDNKNHKFTYI